MAFAVNGKADVDTALHEYEYETQRFSKSLPFETVAISE